MTNGSCEAFSGGIVKTHTTNFYASTQTSSFKIKSVFQDKSLEEYITDYVASVKQIQRRFSLRQKYFQNGTVCSESSKDHNVWKIEYSDKSDFLFIGVLLCCWKIFIILYIQNTTDHWLNNGHCSELRFIIWIWVIIVFIAIKLILWKGNFLQSSTHSK